MLSLLSAVPGAASAVPPGEDFPRLPRVCATPEEQIPRKFVFCQLNRFEPVLDGGFLWGDSHAFMMAPAVLEAASGKDVNVIAFLLGGCPPVLPTTKHFTKRKARNGCEAAGELVVSNLRRLQRTTYKPKVILGINWDIYLTGLENRRRGRPAYNEYITSASVSFRRGTPRLFSVLGRMGADVDVLAPVGQVPASRKRCRAGEQPYRCTLPRFRVLHRERSRYAYAQRTARRLAGTPRLIDVNGEFCDRRHCRGRVAGTFTWYDHLHISATMSRDRMATYFEPSIDDLVPGHQSNQGRPATASRP